MANHSATVEPSSTHTPTMNVTVFGEQVTGNFTALDELVNITNATNQTAEEARAPQYTDYVEFNMAVRMLDIYTFLLFIPGIFGNFLALCVILRKNMRGMSSSVFVASLAVFDNICLLGFLLGMLSYVYVPHVFGRGFCMSYVYLLSTGSMISAWTVVTMSFERVLIVTFPLKAPNWTSRTKAILCELILITICILHNTHYFWTTISIPPCSYDYNKYGTFLGIYSIYDACMTSYVPLVSIFLLNAIIIIQMSRARAIQKKMSNTPNQDSKGTNATNQITVMLMTVSIAFFFCMLPFGILQIFTSYVYQPQDMTIALYAKLSLANQVCTMLWMVNHSINVVLYSLTGRKFRHEMLSMFTCGSYSARPQASKYATSTGLTKSTRAEGTAVTAVSTVSSTVN